MPRWCTGSLEKGYCVLLHERSVNASEFVCEYEYACELREHGYECEYACICIYKEGFLLRAVCSSSFSLMQPLV